MTGKSTAASKNNDSKLAVKKTAGKGKAANDPNMPKRPAGPFFIFMEDFRKQFKEENPSNNSVAAVGKAGGAKWKALSAAEKTPYEATSAKRKKQYEKEMAAYNKKLSAGGKYDESEESDKSKSEVNNEEEEDDSEEAWKIVKDYPKCLVQPLVGEESAGSNKKRKSSESSGWENPTPPTPIDELIPNLNEDPTPTRKNKGKKKMGEEASSQLQTSSVLKEYADKKLNLMQLSVTKETDKQDKYMALLKEQRSYVEEQRSFVAGERLKSDIEFLTKPHDHMSESMQQIVIARKRQICEQHGWPCDF